MRRQRRAGGKSCARAGFALESHQQRPGRETDPPTALLVAKFGSKVARGAYPMQQQVNTYDFMGPSTS
eukprot:scaffold680960_cov62-Prasinocladus_malaysianus.AAC.1